MDLFFLRHAEAENIGMGRADADRVLTPKGEAQSRDVAQWAAAHKVSARLIVTSPYPRARQTAEPVARALGIPLVEDERLSAGSFDLAALTGILADHPDAPAVMFVGHEPDLSRTIADLIGGRVVMKKAALAMVRCDRVARDGGELAWLTTPAARK
jgi:phosphohistidine phosphatase